MSDCSVDWQAPLVKVVSNGTFGYNTWCCCIKCIFTSYWAAYVMIEIDPTVDDVCKMLLGNPSHSNLTIHFLNAVLKPASPIVEVEYINPTIPKEFASDKLAILDILATDKLGRRFNIEVQRTNAAWLPKRLTYYVATQLVNQIGEGENYSRLRPSISICILKASMFPHLEAYHHEFRLRTADGLTFTDCLEIHVLELPKYGKLSDNKRVEDPLDQWMEFFNSAHGANPAEIRTRLPSSVFEEAIGVLEMISQTAEQRMLYFARLKAQLDENTREQTKSNYEQILKKQGLNWSKLRLG